MHDVYGDVDHLVDYFDGMQEVWGLRPHVPNALYELYNTFEEFTVYMTLLKISQTFTF